MVKMYNFNDRNKLSDNGQNNIIKYLQKQEATLRVEDVSNNPAFQIKNIDLILYKKDGITINIEIKTDERMHKTGNFFFETISNDLKGTPGCFMYSEADEFYYYDIISDILYIFDLKIARDWFTKNIGKFKEVATATSTLDSKSNVLYRTIGRLVPIEVINNNIKISIIKNISSQ